MSIPGQTMGISVFTDSLIEVLKLSRVNLSLAYLIGTLTSALILTPAGKLYDRFGARAVGSVTIFFLALQILFLSRLAVVVPVLQRGGGIAARIAPFIVITVSFFFLRFLGQGMLTLVSRNMVMKWFEAKRGLANAIMGTFVTFGFSYAPKLFNSLINQYEWDGAWFRMSLLLITAVLLIFWLFARDNPRECGLLPDGGKGKMRGSEKGTAAAEPSKDFTLAEARRTLPFWVFSLSLCLTALISTAMTFHIVSIFQTSGMTRDIAVGIFLPASVISVCLNFAASWLSDHIPIRYILLIHIIGQILTLVFIAGLGPGTPYVLLIIGYGILMGLFNVLMTIVWPKYFGVTHLGAISGMSMAFIVAGSAVGPYLFSLSLKITGFYRAACWFSLGFSLILFVLSFWVRKPEAPR